MWTPLIILLAALFRSVFGWLENAIGDGKIDLIEWKKLGETIFRMSIPFAGLIYGLNLTPEVAAGVSIFIDWIVVKIYNALQK